MTIDYKPRSQADYQQKQDKQRARAVRGDIRKIDEALEGAEKGLLLETHSYIDGKYQSCIQEWGKSMYAYDMEFGFANDMLGEEALIFNLSLMKAKLEAYKQNWNAAKCGSHSKTGQQLQNVNVSISNKNAINISLTFDEASEKIEGMTALTREETDEILQKINQLETIATEKSSSKEKWEKIKPILHFIMGKGVDVAMIVIKLLSQIEV